jgi:SpoVK/Ycf46/Vps4 family AAA+-type ATPase
VVYQSIAGKGSLHEFCNNNGWRLIDFATMENMNMMSTYLQRKKYTKKKWASPDGTTKNQIDRVLIQARHRSTLLDVRSCRGADSDSDHYMVKIRIRQRITSKNKNSGEKRIKYNTDKLKEEDIKEIYQETISQALDNNNKRKEHISIEDDWKAIKETITNVAESVLCKTTRQENGMMMNVEEEQKEETK